MRLFAPLAGSFVIRDFDKHNVEPTAIVLSCRAEISVSNGLGLQRFGRTMACELPRF